MDEISSEILGVAKDDEDVDLKCRSLINTLPSTSDKILKFFMGRSSKFMIIPVSNIGKNNIRRFHREDLQGFNLSIGPA